MLNFDAISVPIIINVVKNTPVLIIENKVINKVRDAVDFNLNITSINKLSPIVYNSVTPTIATIDTTGKVHIVKVGTVKFIITQVENNLYNTGYLEVTLNITKATPIITVIKSFSKIYGDTPFSIGATSTNTITPINYVSSNPAIASINSSTGLVTINSVGTVTITATQTEGSEYLFSSNTSTIIISQKVSKITIPSTFNVKLTSKSLQLKPVLTNTSTNITYTTSNKNIATVSKSGLVKFIKKGKVTITLQQPVTNNYTAAKEVVQITIA